MAYIDKQYFLKRIKESELNNLIKDEAGTPQDAYLNEIIAAADDFINGYLRKRVKTIPLTAPSESIRQMSYYVATYYLHDRIQYTDIPERVKSNYDVAVNYLEGIASGKIQLDIQTEQIEGGIYYESEDFRF